MFLCARREVESVAVSNRDCVGVQWINPCINGSGRQLAWDCKSSFAGPFGLDSKSFRS
jgi:hypothetical protein